LARLQQELRPKNKKRKEPQDRARAKLVKKQRAQRERLKSKLDKRRIFEAEQRQARFRSGLQGLWDRVRGEHRKIRKENELDAWQAHVRDQKQMDELVFRDLEDRRALKRGQSVEQSLLVQSDTELSNDRERFEELRKKPKLSSQRDPTFER